MGRVFFLSEHSEGYVGVLDFSQEVAEIFAVDFGDMHFEKGSCDFVVKRSLRGGCVRLISASDD